MAGERQQPSQAITTERTLAESPDDTAPPEEDVTRITEPAVDPDATLADSSTPHTSDADATRLESEGRAEEKTLVLPEPADAEQSQTFLMEPAADSSDSDDTAATRIVAAEPEAEDATRVTRPGDANARERGRPVKAAGCAAPRDSRDEPTIVAAASASETATQDDAGAGTSDPYDRTVVQSSDASPASGTVAESVPPEQARQSEFPGLGRFQILKLLGQGAFGAVYLAHDPHLDRRVAIKVAKTGILVGKQDVDRFMREARSAAQLRHPNIVPVYEVGQLPHTNFIAYEYIEGRTLGAVLKERKRFSPSESAVYMRKIAAGLHYAHQHGIVHRDMKPENVLLDAGNEPHIADFGLARRDEKDTLRTREGMFMGTPSYMSPEQASGRAHLADARSDVWSLGVMLQEMLTGVRPFRGNVTEVLVAVQNQEPPSVRAIDRSIPRDLETIVEKCLMKNVEQRYQSAQMLADELERYLRGEPILARPVGVIGSTWRWMKRRPDIASLLGIIALVLMAAAGVSFAFGVSASRSQRRARESALQRAETQLTSLRTADAASLPVLIESLQPYRDELRSQLMASTRNRELSDSEVSRARLAATTLFPDAPQHAELVAAAAGDLLGVSPQELRVRTQMLQSSRAQLEGPLWKAAQDGGLPQQTRFQALAALAALESKLPQWPQVTADMVAEMLAMNPLELSSWLPAVRPIRDELEPALTASFTTGRDRNEQYRAAMVLGELFRDTPETLIALVPQAEPAQLPPLLEALKPRGDFFAERLSDQLLQKLATADERPPTDEQAAEAVNLALALLGLGRSEPVWPFLKQSPNEQLRTSLIHSIVPAGIRWGEIATRLEWEQDPSITAALCLILGEYGDGDLLPNDRERLASGLLKLFDTHPHAGVHSAVEWVLRRWGRGAQVDAAIAQLKASDREEARRWHIDGQGKTFAVLGPATFLMGSPADEPHRSAEETQHKRLIPRTYGIATREVTIAEYMEFDPDYKINIARRFAPEDTCPVINIKWYDAVAFCRWLSEREGFEEHEMCYPPLEDLNVLRTQFGARSLELPEDLLDRPGYRLPTAAEWEYAARAGALTARPFGDPPTYAGEYAWYRDNAKDRAWPTGLLKPNDNGLFDIQGNALEWCQNYFFETPPPPGADGIVVDGLDKRDGFNRECRGGSNRYPIESLRLAYADPIPPGNIDTDFGFRLARTYRTVEQPSESPSTAPTGETAAKPSEEPSLPEK